MKKYFWILLVLIFIILSCDRKKSQLHIEYDNGSYYVRTEDNRIVLSFLYDENLASFPLRLIVPNYDNYDVKNNPIMIFYEFTEDLNLRGYHISDGKYFEETVDALPYEDIYVTHSMKINNKDIIYSIKNDGTINIIDIYDNSEFTTVDE